MCGIFGIIASQDVSEQDLKILATHARQRGRDSSGFIFSDKQGKCLTVSRADFDVLKHLKKIKFGQPSFVCGHSRLVTNGLRDNQPVVTGDIAVLHNGIVTNYDDIWPSLTIKRELQIDTEIINAISLDGLKKNKPLTDIAADILSLCKGTISCAVLFSNLGKLLLLSNNGSLYHGQKNGADYFSSERYPLEQVEAENIHQLIHDEIKIIDITPSTNKDIHDYVDEERLDLITNLGFEAGQAEMLQFNQVEVKRCTKCILPETMPFIKFNEKGVCNYCENYKIRNNPKPKEELFALLEPYRKKEGVECIVPFSGGRDSCYGLDLIVKELGLKPITYTYDWGMVTDLGRRNISRMCAELGVENIIVADDIVKKRDYIAKNLKAWLANPELGMISILTAGDKHFFRHIENIKKQTAVSLNLWGINPLEVTHFKSGFLGVAPDFAEERVYTNGALKQLHYQKKRFGAMLRSPGYFNSSLWDTLSGEYYRSFTEKTDYFHIFDYWKWDEEVVDNTLASYDWEKAIDTNTTWRIGDGTAAFYNYIYHKVAGFTEHDTFRSNQIREGQMTRERALALIDDENRPRYENIKWYLDTLGMPFESVIKTVNNIPQLY